MSRVLAFEVPPGKPVLRGHDHFWRIILDFERDGAVWSIGDIRAQCCGRLDRSSVRDFVKRLVAGGFAVIDSHRADGSGTEPRYRLLKSQLATPCLRRDGTPGLQGRGQAAMWNVIRGPLGRAGFTAEQIAIYASTETVIVARASAASYVKHLAQAGYLTCLREGKPGKPASYRLKPSMHTGPLPPLVLRSQIVFDPNRNEAVGPVEAREVEP